MATVNVGRSSDLSPKAKILYRKVHSLKTQLRIVKKRSSNFKERLKLAKKHGRESLISSSLLREETVSFCMEQLLRKKGKPRGRRFTFDEKVMSLALYKTSGPGYRFLSKWFHLPSKRTLSRLLQKIPVGAGVNDFLFDNLKESVKTLKEKEKLCMLTFDEISLLPHVDYDKHNDMLVGVENGRIVDHALVFMLRGVTQKWKQTISYTFCRGSTKAIEIKQMLRELISRIKETGIYIIFISHVTVCRLYLI